MMIVQYVHCALPTAEIWRPRIIKLLTWQFSESNCELIHQISLKSEN